MIYPSGVPTSVFKVRFSYSYGGRSGRVEVEVDPLVGGGGRRNNRRNGQ